MTTYRTRTTFGIASLIVREAIKSFLRNNNFEMSAALTFYGFFALIPMLFFVIYLLSNVAVSSQLAIQGIENLTTHMFPQLSNIFMKEVFFLTGYKKMWGIVGFIIVFLAVIPLTDTLRTAFRQTFRVQQETSFIRAQIFNSITVFIMLFLFILLVCAEILYSIISNALFSEEPYLLIISGFFASLLVATLFLSAFYRTFSPRRIKKVHLFVSSLIIAVLLILTRYLFALFLSINPQYGYVFGSLKMIFVTFIWIYCSFLIIIFGAELIVNAGKKDALLLKGLFLENPRQSFRTLMNKFITTYQEGDVIFREGESGDNMFYILNGSVTVSRKGQTISIIEKGGYFGEMSMLLNTHRTATAIVMESDTQLVSISQNNFDVILSENPNIVLSILKEMTSRLKRTDENI